MQRGYIDVVIPDTENVVLLFINLKISLNTFILLKICFVFKRDLVIIKYVSRGRKKIIVVDEWLRCLYRLYTSVPLKALTIENTWNNTSRLLNLLKKKTSFFWLTTVFLIKSIMTLYCFLLLFHSFWLVNKSFLTAVVWDLPNLTRFLHETWFYMHTLSSNGY